MGKLGVNCFSVSLDGFGAGQNQDLQNPLGVGGMALHEWFFSTRTFQKVHGTGGGTTGIDDDFAARGFAGIDVAKDHDVRLGGGVATIRQYLQAGLVDEMHLAIAPVLLGAGESLLTGIDLLRLGYRVSEHVASPKATHVVLTRDATRKPFMTSRPPREGPR